MPIGPTELIIVLPIILFIFGADKLPQVGSGLGKSIREFRGGFKDESAAPSPNGEMQAGRSRPQVG